MLPTSGVDPVPPANQTLPSGPFVSWKLPSSIENSATLVPAVVILPIFLASANHMFPSAPAAIPSLEYCIDTGNSVATPAVVTRATVGCVLPVSMNQRLPAGPPVIAPPAVAVERTFSVIVPLVVHVPSLTTFAAPSVSVNHRFPSGPATIATAPDPVGIGNSVMVPPGVMRPMLPASSVNHTLPSGPFAIPMGDAAADCRLNSTASPAVVIRPILPLSLSVNQRFPSGPATMEPKVANTAGTGNSVSRLLHVPLSQ